MHGRDHDCFRSWKSVTKEVTCEKCPEGSVEVCEAERTMKVIAQSYEMAWYFLVPETEISGAGLWSSRKDQDATSKTTHGLFLWTISFAFLVRTTLVL